MKTWNIELSTATRWIACGNISADDFDAAYDLAVAKASSLRAPREKLTGGVISRLVSLS